MVEKIIKETKEGILIDIDVTPNAKKNEIGSINEWRNRLEVKIKAMAKDGKANKEIVKLFKNIFKKDVEIVSGLTSPQKTLLIKDAKKEEVIKILENLVKK
ncbi:DUF167 family protein [Methanotorris igneus]|uniref:UPF0235 protein Metig_0725 n=1 Tax=Methanotorris igneus (strain DSM 5666 / JCM 11834 / Kol 5) TaxID=880724 RepID=F6BCR4_METIK|nr:DUF167 family protein [Methanotorris igneus]AEF96275.1 UPF0235 protein yggU [Methanotorris igneus Kol 5]